MSRMAIPTMDVVRFKEDDVIVASFGTLGLPLPQSSRSLQLFGMNDEGQHDAYIVYSDSADRKVYLKDIKHKNMWLENDFITLSVKDLTQLDNKTKTSDIENGKYVLIQEDGDETLWKWMHQ